MDSVKLVLDTDIGTDVDDALALAFALNSPEIELLAVTVVSTEVKLRSRLAAKIVNAAGQGHISQRCQTVIRRIISRGSSL